MSNLPLGAEVIMSGKDARTQTLVDHRGVIRQLGLHTFQVEFISGPLDGDFIVVDRRRLADIREEGPAFRLVCKADL